MAVLGTKTVVGVFDSVSAAEDARATLLQAGVSEKRIALSGGLTDDPLAAEAPGQSFENQPGQEHEKKTAQYGEAVRSGGCVVSVFARSDEESHYVERLMREKRAYRTGIRP
jgi:hypothetical protein